MSALSTFLQTLPRRPYCSDDLAHGVQIRRKDFAVAKSYIQPNYPGLMSWLVFDCDHDDTFGCWDDGRLAPPNLAVMNRDNGRGHLFYLLNPVCTSSAARIRPLRYLAAIQQQYTCRLRADPGFAGLVAKNPHSASWHVHELHAKMHSLGDLADWVDLRPLAQGAAIATIANGLGRNCTLFDRLRTWAYGRVDLYRRGVSIARASEMFANACQLEAVRFNDFPTALPLSEVRATAKSVARWTWQNYQGEGVKRGRDGHGLTRHHGFNKASGLYLPIVPKMDPAEANARKQQAALNTASQKNQTTAARIATARATLKAMGKPAIQTAIAQASGLSLSTVKRHQKGTK